jgi:regulator of sigma E protease
VDEYPRLDRALQESNGQPVTLTVKNADGKTRQEEIRPKFIRPFDGELDFAGLAPRTAVAQVQPNSSAKDKLMPDDVVLQLTFQNGGDTVHNPTVTEFRQRLEQAGRTAQPMNFVVLRDGKEVEVNGLVPNVRIAKGVYGLNVAPSYDQDHAVVAATLKDSPAAAAGIPAGATITAINNEPVKNWFDVKRLLSAAQPDQPVTVAAQTANGPKTYTLTLGATQITRIAGLRYTSGMTYSMAVLEPRIEPRKTDKLSTAAAWGVSETRDFILQFYVTLHRMFQGRVSYKNMMGPVGIFNAGRHFADRGTDWLIWFLAMISANLAVVNFLPIPIVDGGLFTFLIVEKIQGRPISAKTQSIAQFVGLAIILSVFLLVTYQDIMRLVM